jgi:hypothetical protein
MSVPSSFYSTSIGCALEYEGAKTLNTLYNGEHQWLEMKFFRVFKHPSLQVVGTWKSCSCKITLLSLVAAVDKEPHGLCMIRARSVSSSSRLVTILEGSRHASAAIAPFRRCRGAIHGQISCRVMVTHSRPEWRANHEPPGIIRVVRYASDLHSLHLHPCSAATFLLSHQLEISTMLTTLIVGLIFPAFHFDLSLPSR